MNTLEKAVPEMLDVCWNIVTEGRKLQWKQGLMEWTSTDPGRDTLQADIDRGTAYLFRVEGEPAGYLCLEFDGEPGYADINGEWETQEPYGLLRRIAFGAPFQGKGLASAALALMEGVCREKGMASIRADSDMFNDVVKHILESNGYRNSGLVIVDGKGRMAFEKAL